MRRASCVDGFAALAFLRWRNFPDVFVEHSRLRLLAMLQSTKPRDGAFQLTHVGADIALGLQHVQTACACNEKPRTLSIWEC